MTYTSYTTKEKDRYDTIAYDAYGVIGGTMISADYPLGISPIGAIIDANPSVAIYDELPAGIDLVIPILITAQTVSTGALPPWRQ
jgi:phage tail protein X